MAKGRKRTTGVYRTREELIHEVLDDYNRYMKGLTDWPLHRLASYNGISEATFNKIGAAKGEYLLK